MTHHSHVRSKPQPTRTHAQSHSHRTPSARPLPSCSSERQLFFSTHSIKSRSQRKLAQSASIHQFTVHANAYSHTRLTSSTIPELIHTHQITVNSNSSSTNHSTHQLTSTPKPQALQIAGEAHAKASKSQCQILLTRIKPSSTPR